MAPVNRVIGERSSPTAVARRTNLINFITVAIE